MVKKDKAKDLKDTAVFIAFHPTDSSRFEKDLLSLKFLVDKYMKSTQRCEYSNSKECEIIFRLDRPDLEDTVKCEEFFKGLSLVFSNTSEYNPHFTQHHESETK